MLNLITLWFVTMAVTCDGATLSGTICDENGTPLVGATVSIYTAKPRVGTGTICPSCYKDCKKFSLTDAEGKFSISGLDSGLLFNVLVMAPARRSQIANLIDPQTTQLDVQLERFPNNLPIQHMLTGRVVDPQGKPIAGAYVSAVGAKTPEQHLFGLLPGVDKTSVTDWTGRFAITTQEPKLGLDLRASAEGFAVFPTQHFRLDGQEHEIQMQYGSSVTGRLMFEGQPVRNERVGIVQRNRSSNSFVRERVVATNEHGRFEFTDLQPNESYVLYTLCQAADGPFGMSFSVPGHPVLKTQEVDTPYSGKSTDVGELELIRGLTLSGRVVFPAEAIEPDELTIRLGRDPAWDWFETTVGSDGEFSFHGLPPEVYQARLFAPGFEIDAKQARFQLLGPNQFAFRLRADQKATHEITIQLH